MNLQVEAIFTQDVRADLQQFSSRGKYHIRVFGVRIMFAWYEK